MYEIVLAKSVVAPAKLILVHPADLVNSGNGHWDLIGHYEEVGHVTSNLTGHELEMLSKEDGANAEMTTHCGELSEWTTLCTLQRSLHIVTHEEELTWSASSGLSLCNFNERLEALPANLDWSDSEWFPVLGEGTACHNYNRLEVTPERSKQRSNKPGLPGLRTSASNNRVSVTVKEHFYSTNNKNGDKEMGSYAGGIRP